MPIALLAASACASLQHALTTPPELLTIPAELAHAAGLSPLAPEDGPEEMAIEPGRRVVATVAFRVDATGDDDWVAERVVASRTTPPMLTRAALVGFGGPTRDQAAVLRLLHTDTLGRRRAARDVVRAAASESAHALIVAFGPGTPREIEPVLGMLDALGRSARDAGIGSLIAHVPGHDTAGYPTRVVARAADALLISPLPAAVPAEPAPFFTGRSVAQVVRLRAAEIGAARLILLLPLHGYLWERRTPPRPISYQAAMELAREWRVPLARDADSRMLFARAPDGGVMMLPDAPLITHIVREARAMGVGRFAFVLGAGEDPALLAAIAPADQTTSRSRW